VDITKDMAFSMQLMNEFFPTLANAAVEKLKQANSLYPRMEDWRVTQLCHFIEIFTESIPDLKRAHIERKTSTLAWLARNLLELSVWVQYCNLSLDHAKRFHLDAVKDMYGWTMAIHDLYFYRHGETDPQSESKLSNLIEFAISRGVSELADDFTRVSIAAKEVESEIHFKNANKIFSKFAHPTAWVVASVDSQQANSELRDMLFLDGVNLAVVSVIVINGEIERLFPEVRESTKRE
jgi:hypothetical protein